MKAALHLVLQIFIMLYCQVLITSIVNAVSVVLLNYIDFTPMVTIVVKIFQGYIYYYPFLK